MTKEEKQNKIRQEESEKLLGKQSDKKSTPNVNEAIKKKLDLLKSHGGKKN